MKLSKQALSSDGFIIDQRRTETVDFGCRSSDRNGCGWIAAYNFLKAMDREPDPEKTLRDLEKTLLFGGRLGLNFFALAAYLHKQGIPLQCAVTPFHTQQLSEHCRAGIILYRAGRTSHFAAFRREADGRLRFFGAEPGNAEDITSMAAFRWDHVKFPLTLTIMAK